MDQAINLECQKYCIVGAGGFGRETLLCLIDLYRHSNYKIEDIVVFLVDDEYYSASTIHNIPVIKRSEFEPSLYGVVVAIGEPAVRKKVVAELPSNTAYVNVIHPQANVSDLVTLGQGCIITAGVIMTCDIVVGDHAHLNLHTTIGHDCCIGDFFTSAPGANISGNCSIGDCVNVGTGAAIREGIKVCSDTIIGMSSAVVKDIAQPGVYIGCPAKRLDK